MTYIKNSTLCWLCVVEKLFDEYDVLTSAQAFTTWAQSSSVHEHERAHKRSVMAFKPEETMLILCVD